MHRINKTVRTTRLRQADMSVRNAKISPPSSSKSTVDRPALADRIAKTGNPKLVLVRAPAGFGKTTAMLQGCARMQSAGIATAWITMDAADNDVPRFLACLAAAVAPLQFDHHRLDKPIDVIDALGRETMPFALFIDDFEMIQSQAVLGLVREIIEHLPRGGQLVIGTRNMPDLGLGRLRARGQLAEIAASHLRFSLEEAQEYLQLRGCLGLSSTSLAQLHSKTEGWVAALWLASLALEQHETASEFIERFSGSDLAIADYLAEDVLAHQPTEVRDFLLRTSILRNLNASLCLALLPRIDSTRILEQLQTSNLFLSPVEDDEGSFRYHSLFADYLRGRLTREHPQELQRLHLAASAWYESAGRPVPAIDHALEGGDHPHALDLMAQHVERFLEDGRMRLLARWFGQMPAEILAQRPLMMTLSMWAICFTLGPWQAMERLEASGCSQSDDPTIQAHVYALRPLLLAMMDRYEEAYLVGQSSLSRLPSHVPFADGVLSNAMAHIVAVLGHQHEAHRLLDAARSMPAGGVFNRMYSESTEGMLDLEQGRLRQAKARFNVAVNSTSHANPYTHANGNAWAGVLYAAAVYEAGDLDLAERLVNVYLPLARDVGLPDHMIVSHTMRSRLAFHRGDVDHALRVLTELEYLGHNRHLPRVAASAKLERARLFLLQGNADASRAELTRAEVPQVWERVERQHLPAHFADDLTIGRLRWSLHFEAAQDVVPTLEKLLDAATAARRLLRALKLRVLLAIARWRCGQREEAIQVFEVLLADASREGYLRLILDEGAAVAPVIHAASSSSENSTLDRDPVVSGHLQRLFMAVGPPSTHDQAPTAGEPFEPLTQKEIGLLKLLAEGYSNSALAEKLFISESTVRTHLRSINLKLGAGNRTQAVSIARRVGVIR